MMFYYVPPDPIDFTRVNSHGDIDWDVSLEETVKRDIVSKYLGERVEWVSKSIDFPRHDNDAPCLVYAYIFSIIPRRR